MGRTDEPANQTFIPDSHLIDIDDDPLADVPPAPDGQDCLLSGFRDTTANKINKNNNAVCLRKGSNRSTTSSMSSSSFSSSSVKQPSSSSSYPSVTAPPPDGGWGWIIVLASFLCNVIVDGIIFSFGVTFPKIQAEFSSTKGTTAWIGSLQAGCYLFIGPVVAGLAGRYGCRVVTIIGSIIASFGFLLSFWANSVLFLYFSFGIIGGVGFGFIYLPAIVTVGHYFEKKRAFATGIAVCGSGMGAFIMAPVVQELSEVYGWRGCILILAPVILSCALFGSLFRPFQEVPIMPKREKLLLYKDIEESKKRRKLRKKSSKWHSSGDISDDEGYGGQRKDCHGVNDVRDSKASSSLYPNLALVDKQSSISKTLLTTTSELTAASGLTTTTSINSQRRSMPDLMHLFPHHHPVPDIIDEDSSSELRPRTLTEADVLEEKNETGIVKARSQVFALNIQLFKKRNSTPCFMYDPLNKETIPEAVIEEESEPPIMTGCDVKNEINHESPQDKVLTTKKCYDSGGDESLFSSSSSDSFWTSFSSDMRSMLDPDLLYSPSFLLLGLSGFLTLAGFFIPFTYIFARAELLKISSEKAAYLLSAIGITNTFGRIFCGWISDHPRVNALMINNLALVAGGAATFLSPVICNDFISLAVYGCVFGFSIACLATLRSIIIVDLHGLEKLTPAFGLLLLPQGIATIIGTPFAGWLFDLSGSYDSSFYVSGAVITISGLMCFPLKKISEWERRRKCQKDDDEDTV